MELLRAPGGAVKARITLKKSRSTSRVWAVNKALCSEGVYSLDECLDTRQEHHHD